MAFTIPTLNRETSTIAVNREGVLFACLRTMFVERVRSHLYSTNGAMPTDDELRVLAEQTASTYPCHDQTAVVRRLLAGD